MRSHISPIRQNRIRISHPFHHPKCRPSLDASPHPLKSHLQQVVPGHAPQVHPLGQGTEPIIEGNVQEDEVTGGARLLHWGQKVGRDVDRLQDLLLQPPCLASSTLTFQYSASLCLATTIFPGTHL